MSYKYTDKMEQLAIELHKFHRAAEKAMNRTPKIWRKGRQIANTNKLLHDHGFYSCGKQEYFRKRARLLIARMDGKKLDGTLQEIVAQLQAKLVFLGLVGVGE